MTVVSLIRCFPSHPFIFITDSDLYTLPPQLVKIVKIDVKNKNVSILRLSRAILLDAQGTHNRFQPNFSWADLEEDIVFL